MARNTTRMGTIHWSNLFSVDAFNILNQQQKATKNHTNEMQL
jgi:hypothetical protein